METRAYKGKWWIPSTPDNQVSGHLIVGTNGVVKLELIGAFEQKEKGIDLEREDAVIFGHCFTPNNHAKEISLFECHAASIWNPSLSFTITRYTCRYALIGIHMESMDVAAFFKAQIHYNELTYWCPPNNIKCGWSESEISFTVKTAEDEASKLATIHLEDGFTLNLKENCNFNHPSDFAVYADQLTCLEVLKEGMSVDDAVMIDRQMERFLTFATLLPVEHTKIWLYSKEKCQVTDEGVPQFHAIELVTYLCKEKPEKIKDYNFLFKHIDVADVFPDMFKRMYSSESISLIWTMLLDSLQKKRVFTSNDFLLVAQALDGFAKRFRTGKHIESELTELRDEFQDIGRQNLTDEDLKEAAGSRNYYSHVLRVDLKEDKKAQDGLKLYDLMARLRVLLICCVLDFLGLDHTMINQMLNNSNNAVLRPRKRGER